MSGSLSLRRRIHELLEPAEDGDRASSAVDLLVFLLILVDLACFVAFDGRVHVLSEQSRSIGSMLVHAVLFAFTAEYVLRLWVAPEDRRYAGRLGRLRYARTPLALVDLVAIFPLFLLGVSAVLPSIEMELPQLTAIRMFRMLKLFRYFEAAQVLGRTISRVRHELGVLSVAVSMAVMSSGLLMHRIEGEANPDDFGTIGDSLWWALVTLTTVGYGDAVPATGTGKVVAGVMMVFGIGMFAVPAGLLGAAFTREVTVAVERRRARSERRQRRLAEEREERLIEAAFEHHLVCPHCGEALQGQGDGERHGHDAGSGAAEGRGAPARGTE